MNPAARPPTRTLAQLAAAYDTFLLDAYGVLVHAEGPLPGAAAALAFLRQAGKRFLVVSNDASRSIATSHARYVSFGLPLQPHEILTSGALLPTYFEARGLRGQRCLVMGTADSHAHVEESGGILAPPDDDSASVLVVADDDGFPFLETFNAVISTLLRRIDRDDPVHLILPNPDLIFPLPGGQVGLTAGGIAHTIEAILDLRQPGRHRFVPLGKPHAPIYEAAFARLSDLSVGPPAEKARTIMLGDQLATDILGATRAGIDSALVLTGVGRVRDIAYGPAVPTYLMDAFTP